jgi:ubiquinone/menaquinone biosynthesis C-methylase UbiE
VAYSGARPGLDACCGTGEFALQLGRTLRLRELTAVELLPALASAAADKLARILQSTSITVVRGDVTTMPAHFEGNFDLVTCLAGWYVFVEVKAGLQRLASYVAPGGILVLDDTALNGKVPRLADHLASLGDDFTVLCHRTSRLSVTGGTKSLLDSERQLASRIVAVAVREDIPC